MWHPWIEISKEGPETSPRREFQRIEEFDFFDFVKIQDHLIKIDGTKV